MSNLVQRIIMFCLFIPLIIALILLFPQLNHLALQCMILLVTAGLSLEVARIYSLRPAPASGATTPEAIRPVSALLRIVAIVSCGLAPLAGRMLHGFGLFGPTIIALSFTVPVLWIFSSQVVRSQKVPFELFARNTAAYLLILAYPGLGMSYFLALMFLPDASMLLLVFLGAVFLNDTFAYLAGRMFGKYSSKPLRISPNKTTVGFIAGYFASPLVMVAGWFFRPGLFPGGFWVALGIGLIMGVLTIIGDLFESGIKRSFSIKDSGTIILGRGGLLDSLDSLIFTSPFFYFSYVILNQFTQM